MRIQIGSTVVMSLAVDLGLGNGKLVQGKGQNEWVATQNFLEQIQSLAVTSIEVAEDVQIPREVYE